MPIFPTNNNKEKGCGGGGRKQTLPETSKSNIDISYGFSLKEGSVLYMGASHTQPSILKSFLPVSIAPGSPPQQPPCPQLPAIPHSLFLLILPSNLSSSLLAAPPHCFTSAVKEKGDCEHACVNLLCVFITTFRVSSQKN